MLGKPSEHAALEILEQWNLLRGAANDPQGSHTSDRAGRIREIAESAGGRVLDIPR
jgi:hypothetical protein